MPEGDGFTAAAVWLGAPAAPTALLGGDGLCAHQGGFVLARSVCQVLAGVSGAVSWLTSSFQGPALG